jgi:hypothetical protein
MWRLLFATTALALWCSLVPARAGKVMFSEDARGCPTADGLYEVYRVGDSYDAVKSAVSHYDCEVLAKGVSLTLIRKGPLISIVVLPRVFSKDEWLYVRTIDLEH